MKSPDYWERESALQKRNLWEVPAGRMESAGRGRDGGRNPGRAGGGGRGATGLELLASLGASYVVGWLTLPSLHGAGAYPVALARLVLIVTYAADLKLLAINSSLFAVVPASIRSTFHLRTLSPPPPVGDARSGRTLRWLLHTPDYGSNERITSCNCKQFPAARSSPLEHPEDRSATWETLTPQLLSRAPTTPPHSHPAGSLHTTPQQNRRSLQESASIYRSSGPRLWW